jgi:cutinase
MHGVVGQLPTNVKRRVVGGVLFGDTMYDKNDGRIPDYPKGDVKIFCDRDDRLCSGSLSMSNAHFVYLVNDDVSKALQFLQGKISRAIPA